MSQKPNLLYLWLLSALSLRFLRGTKCHLCEFSVRFVFFVVRVKILK